MTFNSTNKLSQIKLSQIKLSQIKLSLYKNVKSSDNTLTNKFKYINEKLICVLEKPTSMPKELLERLNNGTYINLKWSGKKKTTMFLFFKVEYKYMNKKDEFILTQTINLLFMDKNQKEEYSAGF